MVRYLKTVMLELAGIACARGGRTLFEGIGAQVGGGDLLRVQGANGSGKTSLLRIICGLSLPVQGEIRWQRQPIAALREEYGRHLAYIGHSAALKDDLSACENLQAACLLAGIAVSAAQVGAALAGCGLEGRTALPARLLSQGQRRRAALARLALAAAAPLWVLDEPFNALDAHAAQWLLGLLQAHLRGGGMVVLTSHQPVTLDAAARAVTITL
jgi:heme exporter protein A